MNIQEAYNTLEVSKSDSLDEIKKKYKELVKKYHPDLNPDNASKMKSINEAFDLIKKNHHLKIENEPIIIEKTISFAEAIFGTSIKLEYSRTIHCDKCAGEGSFSNCTTCGGKGFVHSVTKSNFGVFSTQKSCPDCNLPNRKSQCTECFGSGTKSANTLLNVKIPPGIPNNGKLQLRERGNFKTTSHFFQPKFYEDALLIINYVPDNRFTIHNNNVHTNINLTFLESIEGFEKELELFDGSKVTLKSNKQLTDNKFVIKQFGVGRQGDLIIHYKIDPVPDDKLTQIINILKNV